MDEATSLDLFRELWKEELAQKTTGNLKSRESESKGKSKTSESGLSVISDTISTAVGNKDTQSCPLSIECSNEKGDVSAQNVELRNTNTESKAYFNGLKSLASNCTQSQTSKREEKFSLLNRLINPDNSRDANERTFSALRPFQIAGDLLRGKRLGDKVTDLEITHSNKHMKWEMKDETKCTVETEKAEERFLDRLLADLEEINEIPFFDLNLSREVALNIFQHLSLIDLCRCAQVSRSWKSIAEDEYLWCNICHRYGYETSSKTVDRRHWKQIAKECILYEMHLKENWKQRLGQCYPVDYVQGGVLCAASTYHTLIVAGYTSGNVKFNDLSSEESYIYKPSNTSLVLDESEDVGTVTNHITAVAVNDTITVAGFNQGFVDIWQNGTCSLPVHTFQCSAPIRAVALAQDSAVTAVTYGNFVRMEKYGSGGQFQCLELLDMGEDVKGVQVVKNHQASSTSFQHLVVMTTRESVKIHLPGHLTPTCIHSVYDAPVTCLDITSTTVACGVTTALDYTSSGISLYRGKIYLYSLVTGKETCILEGECNAVSCLDISQFDALGLLCTGSDDRRVRVYDTRAGTRHPVHSFSGHGASVTVVHMDDWKVVSGGAEGLVCIWDQRMASKLWEVHNRHPVRHCTFTDKFLISAHVPYNKFPENHELDNMVHKRYRGTVQVYDFSVDQAPEGVPDVCLSTYDEPDRAKGTVGLMVPYDKL